jgi:hypothetical protein
MIRILNTSFERLGIIKSTISSNRIEELNGENTLDFDAILDQKLSDLINEDSIFEVDNDWFDTAYIKKNSNEDGSFSVVIQSEHISYRLNQELYNLEYFAELGTPTYILGKILEDTPFTVGTVEFEDNTAYSIEETKSRRATLMEFVAYLAGDIVFDKFTVSIVHHRGSTSVKPAIKNRNVKIISKEINKRQRDKDGNPTITYTCTPIYLPGDVYNIGDEIILIQNELHIRESLRVVSINRNVYDISDVTFQFSKYVNGLAEHLYRIETSTVVKDKLYNGTRIGPEFGFENVRADKKARSYFRADEMKFQSGDGSGTVWKDRMYFEYEDVNDPEHSEMSLIFDGILHPNVLITPNLYADNGNIAELTVSQLDTSVKIHKYLNSDTSDVNYIKIVGQTIQFIQAYIAILYAAIQGISGVWDMTLDPFTDTYYMSVSINQTTGEIIFSNGAEMNAWDAFVAGRQYRALNSTSYYQMSGGARDYKVKYVVMNVTNHFDNFESYRNHNGEVCYWMNDKKEVMSSTVTDFPVYIYKYNETVKMEQSFHDESGAYIPKLTLGAGTGVGDNGKAFIYKGTDGLYLDYYTSTDGTLRRIALTNGGIILHPYKLDSLDFYTNGFKAVYSDEIVKFTWTKDGDGRITQLVAEDMVVTPVTWHEEVMP